MYIHFNKSGQVSTVLNHGEIPRQGGNYSLNFLFDLDYLNPNNCWVEVTFTSPSGRVSNTREIEEFKRIVFRKLNSSENTFSLKDGTEYYMATIRVDNTIPQAFESAGNITASVKVAESNGNVKAQGNVTYFLEKTATPVTGGITLNQYDEIMAAFNAAKTQIVDLGDFTDILEAAGEAINSGAKSATLRLDQYAAFAIVNKADNEVLIYTLNDSVKTIQVYLVTCVFENEVLNKEASTYIDATTFGKDELVENVNIDIDLANSENIAQTLENNNIFRNCIINRRYYITHSSTMISGKGVRHTYFITDFKTHKNYLCIINSSTPSRPKSYSNKEISYYSVEELNELLSKKADLVDGKVPLEQLDTKETGELLVGTSTNYDISRDDQIPTTKAVNKIVNELGNKKADKSDTYTKTETDNKLKTKADLEDGKIPAAQLPSYVDDVIEGYYEEEEEEDKFYTDITKETEIAAETSKIYVDLNTNKTYRWSGSQYVMISQSLALGETSSTAYSGDKGKANAEAIKKLNEIVPDLLPVEITYEELKALKDNNELIVGQKYRIIDYETTTSKEKTKSAKHPFDIIVTATSENTFDENASACARKGDKYFGTWYEENLSKGAFIDGVTPNDVVPAFSIIVDNNDEIKSNYDDLKGGSDKVVEFSYAKNENGDIVPAFYKNEISYIETGEIPDYGDTFFYVGTEEIDGVVYDKWRKIEGSGGDFDFGGSSKIFVLTNVVVNPNSSTNSIIEHKGKPLDKWKIKYCFDNDKTRFEWAMPKPMIYTDDESWFERSGEIVIDGVTYYKWTSNTFNQKEYLISLTPDVEIGDGLGFIAGDYIEALPSDAYSYCLDKTNGGKGVIYYMKDENDNECPYDFKNIIFNFYFIDKDNEDNSHYEWVFAFTYFDGEKYLDGTMFTFKNNDGDLTSFINNIIKPSIEVSGNIKYYKFYGNVIYHDFELNDDFIIQNNIIGGNSSWDNIIYDSINCSIGDGCNTNIINRYNSNISIGDNCYNNYIGNECDNIKIREDGWRNEIYSFCSDIIINGSDNILNGNCYFITMGINCDYNEFADGCNNITLGNGCDGNEFRVICENITMGNECDNNVFELESCSDITFGNNCNDNHIYKTTCLKIENDCYDNYIYGCELVCLGDYCKDNDFNGVNNLIANVNCCDNHINYSYNITLGSDVSEFKCINKKIKNSTIGNGVKNIEIDAEFISYYPYYSINIKDGVQGVSNSSKLQVYIPKHNEEAIKTQITIDRDQKGQFLMYWSDDKLKKVGYYLESNSSTEWLPIPEENAGVNAEDVMNIVEENAEKTDTLDIGTSDTFDSTSDNQIPTSKAVSDFVASAGGGSKLYRHKITTTWNSTNDYYVMVCSYSEPFTAETLAEYLTNIGCIDSFNKFFIHPLGNVNSINYGIFNSDTLRTHFNKLKVDIETSELTVLSSSGFFRISSDTVTEI